MTGANKERGTPEQEGVDGRTSADLCAEGCGVSISSFLEAKEGRVGGVECEEGFSHL